MIRRISHAALIVEDVTRAIQFYTDVLGFKKIYELTGEVQGHKFTTTYMQISKDQFIELAGGGHVKTEFGMQNIGYNHLCLEVDDFDDAVAKMESKGVPFLVKPCVGIDHARLFWIEDPDGNKIEVMQLTEESLQRKMSVM